jgi:hypothetical protein
MDDDLDFGQTIKGFTEGQKVFGRYTLRRILGRGGMGIVWLAWDDKLERDIALKFMPEMVRLDPSAVDELKRETRKSLSLTHTNIVRIFDYVDDGQSAAIAMEYIDGATLSALRVQKPGRVFEVEELRSWAAQICEALAYAHEETRVVHRDLKPANLMVTSAGRIKVTDFGIARSICDSASRMSMAVGNSSGTLVYMSPQQMDGDDPSALDDVYSLGATFYELLTSRPPFSSGNIYAQVKEKVPAPMNERRAALEVVGEPIPAHWETTIAACMAKDPALRPQSVREVLRGLEGALPPPAPEPPIIGDPPIPPTKPPARKTAILLGLLGAIVLAGGAGYFYGIHLPAKKARQMELARSEAEARATRVEEERAAADRERLVQEQAAEQLRREKLKAEAEAEAARKALAAREAQAKIDVQTQAVRQAISNGQWTTATGELAMLSTMDANSGLVASLRAAIASGVEKQQAGLRSRLDSVAAEIRSTLQSGVGSYGFSLDPATGIGAIELEESARAIHVIQQFDPRELDLADATVSKVGGGFFRDEYSINIPTRQNRESVQVVSPAIPDMSAGSPTKATDRIFFHTDDESHARFVIGRLKVLAQLLTESGVPGAPAAVPATPNPTPHQPQPSPTPASQASLVVPFVRRAVIEDPDGYTNVREGRSKTSAILARVNKGEIFYTYPQPDGWWRIRTASGITGYMHNSRIRLK